MTSRNSDLPRVNRNLIVHICSIGIVPKLFLVEPFRRMRAAGYDVVLVCCDDADARYVAQASGIRFIPVPIKQGVAPISGLIGMARLWRLLRRLRPAITDSHCTKAGVVGTLVSWLARVPIRIYHNHGMALLSARGLKRAVFHLVEATACRFATRVIYVAPSNREDAVAAGVCPPGKAAVLGPGTICGIDPDRFDPVKNAPRGMELRRQAGIPPDSLVCGFVGRIVPHKGIETILQAWRLLPPELRANAYLCIFGSLGTRRMYALVNAAASQPELHVKYLKFSNELPAWYSTMALLAQPSWHEGWGYNVLESACSAVPAVGTRISATVDAIVDGTTGLLVPVKDPQAMAAAIAALLQDPELRRRLGQAARDRALRDFAQENICPLLIHEYARLLNELGEETRTMNAGTTGTNNRLGPG